MASRKPLTVPWPVKDHMPAVAESVDTFEAKEAVGEVAVGALRLRLLAADAAAVG